MIFWHVQRHRRVNCSDDEHAMSVANFSVKISQEKCDMNLGGV